MNIVLKKILNIKSPADKSVPAPVREQCPSPVQSHDSATGFWRRSDQDWRCASRNQRSLSRSRVMEVKRSAVILLPRSSLSLLALRDAFGWFATLVTDHF